MHEHNTTDSPHVDMANQSMKSDNPTSSGSNKLPREKRKRPMRLRDMQSAAQGGGWVWLEKESLDRILIKATGSESGLIIAVYAALCRLSSDRGNAASVTAGTALLVKLSGCSRSTVLRSVAALERVNLITVRRNKRGKMNDENIYLLLASNSRKSAQTPVSKGDHPNASETPGVVPENGRFSDTELEERNSSSSCSSKAKAPMAKAAYADAQQQARRFATKAKATDDGIDGW